MSEPEQEWLQRLREYGRKWNPFFVDDAGGFVSDYKEKWIRLEPPLPIPPQYAYPVMDEARIMLAVEGMAVIDTLHDLCQVKGVTVVEESVQREQPVVRAETFGGPSQVYPSGPPRITWTATLRGPVDELKLSLLPGVQSLVIFSRGVRPVMMTTDPPSGPPGAPGGRETTGPMRRPTPPAPPVPRVAEAAQRLAALAPLGGRRIILRDEDR